MGSVWAYRCSLSSISHLSRSMQNTTPSPLPTSTAPMLHQTYGVRLLGGNQHKSPKPPPHRWVEAAINTSAIVIRVTHNSVFLLSTLTFSIRTSLLCLNWLVSPVDTPLADIYHNWVTIWNLRRHATHCLFGFSSTKCDYYSPKCDYPYLIVIVDRIRPLGISGPAASCYLLFSSKR